MAATRERPNIVVIFTDQQSFRMMGCAGNPHVSTPAMDGLAAGGVRFGRAYCTDPVCVPSRFSLLTGRYPSAIGMRSNVSRALEPIPEEIKSAGMGWLLREAGYEVAYAGKQHLPKMKAEDVGFDVICEDERDELARVSAEFVRARHERPYLLIASFINPHDICYMGIRDFATTDFDRLLLDKGETELAALDRALQRPPGVGDEEFFARHCPPLPPNFEPQQDEPEAIGRMLDGRPFRRRERDDWSPERWREHRWAYCRLTEFVDEQIGVLTDAIGEREDTVVIFTSDHGDSDSAHRLEHKTALYEEPCHVPLIVRQPGAGPAGAVEDRLVSNGLDLLPTVCDYAGVEPPEGLLGRSFRPLAEGRPADGWREDLLVESEHGYALVDARHAYALYDDGANREQLYDLEADPYQTRNFAGDADKREVLRAMRARLEARLAER